MASFILPFRKGIAINKGTAINKGMVINTGRRSPLPSLEAIIILNKVSLFPSHPCFDTSSIDYSPEHLCKAINEEKYVCTLQRCVNLIYLVYANSYHVPMAIVETESHTFLPSHSMIYVFGHRTSF